MTKRINEAFNTNFRLNDLNNIRTFDEKLKYCQQRLGPTFGKGSSRVIFDFTDEAVLKLAYNAKGIEQNRNEYDMSRNCDIVVKCFEVAPDYTWILQEQALPANTDDFKKCLGIEWNTFQDFVAHCFNEYSQNQIDPIFGMKKDVFHYYLDNSPHSDWFQEFESLMGNWKLPCGDMMAISSYGMVNRNGKTQIVVLDSGLTYETWNRYYNLNEEVLNENRESKNINLARKFFINQGYHEDVAQEILDNIRHDIPNSRLGECKFLLGVARMYFDGELDNANIIMNLNKTLKLVASPAHINEYNSDLNGMTCEDLVNRFEQAFIDDLEADRKRSSNREFNTSGTRYTIQKISDYEEAEAYCRYTTWCVTQAQSNYDAYTNDGEGIFYFCLRDDFKTCKEEVGENCPLDDYGLSMIAVSINADGSCNTITCRWNHANGGNDNIMTPEQLENVINMPFYETFKPRTRENILAKRMAIAGDLLEMANDEYGEQFTIADYGNVNGREIYVFSNLDDYYSEYSRGAIILYKDDNGEYDLAYPYAFNKQIFDVIESKEMKCGFYVELVDGVGYSANRYLFNTNTNSYVIGERYLNNNKVTTKCLIHGGTMINAVFVRLKGVEFYNLDGKVIFKSENNWYTRLYKVDGDDFTEDSFKYTNYFIMYANNNSSFRHMAFSIDNENNIRPLFDGKWFDLERVYPANLITLSSGEKLLYGHDLNHPCQSNPIDDAMPGKNGVIFVKNGRKYFWNFQRNEVEDYDENVNTDANQLQEEVSIKPFEPKDELNPRFWINNKLNSRVRMRLLDIADDFVKTLDIRWVKPEDIVLTGSIANYNWTRYSDVDIHIIMDFKKVYEKTDFVKNYFDAKKEEWNSSHEKLRIYGFNVELSVEDKNVPAMASGVYSLEKNDWVSEPKDLSDAKLNKEYVERTAEQYIEKIDKLDERIRKEKDAKKVETLSNKMVSIFNKLKGMRKEGLKSKAKEMSSGNIIWKILRAEGYIKKIWDVVNYNYDRSMSINEAVTGKDNKNASALYVYALDSEDGEWHILCAKRADRKGDEEKGKWNPPMGHLHRGENMVDGAIRECLEESGIDFSDYKSKIKLMDTHRWGNNYRLVLKDKYTTDFTPGKGDEENHKFIWLPVAKIKDKTWAWSCGENAEKYIPKTVIISEEQERMLRNGTITLYHGVNCDNLEYDIEHGGFTPRVCSDGGPKAVWLTETPHNYQFTFKLEMPVELLGKKLLQQTNVDYTYNDFISFDDFSCTLYQTSIMQRWKTSVVEIDLADEEMCRSQFEMMPKIYAEFNDRMKQYPKVYEKFVEPVLSKIGALNESKTTVHTVILTEEQLKEIAPGYNERYLNSYIKKFRERTGIPDLQTSQLHDIMARLHFNQIDGKPGCYRLSDINYLLDHSNIIKQILGMPSTISNSSDSDRVKNFKNYPSVPPINNENNENGEPDYTPPLSNMENASDELLKMDDIY